MVVRIEMRWARCERPMGLVKFNPSGVEAQGVVNKGGKFYPFGVEAQGRYRRAVGVIPNLRLKAVEK